MAKSWIKWDKWKNFASVRCTLWNHWTPSTECTYKIWLWNVQSYLLCPQSYEKKVRYRPVSQPLPTINFVVAMAQGRPYRQNEKYGNSSWKKLFFFCYQNVNHEMLYKSQYCLGYVEKWKKVLKYIEMKAMLIINRGQFFMPLMWLNTIWRCNFCTWLPLCIGYISLNSQMNTKREQCDISVHSGNWKTTITILVNWYRFGWEISFLLSFVRLIPVCLTQWWSDEERIICLQWEILWYIYFIIYIYILYTLWLPPWFGPCHEILFASSGNGDQAIFCNKNIFSLFNRFFPLCPAIISFWFLNFVLQWYAAWYWTLIKLPLN